MKHIVKAQGGGTLLEEDELFADDTAQGVEGAISSEYVDPEPVDPVDPVDPAGPEPVDPEPVNPEPVNPAPVEPVDPAGGDLTGIDMFLSEYGVQGGLISFEDGTTAPFADLDAEEQASILSSLVADSVPSIEEKYNLDAKEIDLLNAVRESGESVEDFINNVVDYRLQSVVAKKEYLSTDYDSKSDDAVFAQHVLERHPELTDEEVADRLYRAKQLETYEDTVGTFRSMYKSRQDSEKSEQQQQDNLMFSEELEAQRAEVVQTVEGIDEIAGAQITTDMKEYLLHDIMELNDQEDPLLMEEVFSSPENMLKVNWFLKYGEDYINNLNGYWKKEVSKAHKKAYSEAVNGMPDGATVYGPSGQAQRANPTGPKSFGREMSEEELFNE